MRTEQITAMALEKVNYDRYLLASAVGKRAKELATGATPLIDVGAKRMKYADIALREIAEGKVSVALAG
jgi:DNA-directed RNA polymerase subunit omega